MRRIGKRGMEDKVWFIMFEIIAFAMVALIIIFAVRGLVNNSSYWKKYYSTDLSLMADLENINQGDFVMNYVLKSNINNGYAGIFLKDRKYDVLLKEDRIEIYDSPQAKSRYPTTYPFARSNAVTVNINTVTSEFLVLSKQKSVLTLDKYLVDTAAVCPSDNTAKNINELKFNAISTDATAKPFAESISAILTTYGTSSKITEATIIVSYEKNSPLTIYYSDDVKKLWSQKLACIMGKTYETQHPDNAYNLKAYDGSLDQNTDFNAYINNPSRNPDEYWVIIQISDKEVALTQNTFSQVIRDTLIKFYE